MMPALAFFAADADDVGILLRHLNEDPELAFLVPVPPIGPLPAPSSGVGNPVLEGQGWQAVRQVTSLGDGQHLLWHLPAGDLLERVPSRKLVPPPGTRIADPWSGWRGRSWVLDGRYVIPEVQAGPGDSGIVRLELRTRYCLSPEESHHMGTAEILWCSIFHWLGSRYAPARKETSRWWDRLKGRFGRTTVKLVDPTGRQVFYAFPSALRRLKSGIKYNACNWNLDASIRAAPTP
jgi:hypothetical protein